MSEAIEKIVLKIIEAQEVIMGQTAWREALKVEGLRLDPEKHEVHIDGDPKEVLSSLVKQYEILFGKMSREICRDAVRPLLAFAEEDEIPEALK